jgi:UDP-N-acetylglucosamine 2-epimerase (non-hydrolysing)
MAIQKLETSELAVQDVVGRGRRAREAAVATPTVLLVFGTRPEAIKLAPVAHALSAHPKLRVRVCVTAQHRQMLDQMLETFGLTPDYDLNLMRDNQDLGKFSALAIPALQRVIRKERPAFLVVQGDTTTAFVGALAAFYERVPVAHVEAGLRSFDRGNPFPEEINRVLTDRLADLHFAPTDVSRRNLLSEGIPEQGVLQTGNTVVDALEWVVAHVKGIRSPELREALAKADRDSSLVLVTTHRRENLGAPLEALCASFQTLAERHPEAHLIYPVHMNPNVQKTVRALISHPRVHLLPTLDYFDLVSVMSRARFVMTDSGGIQEEAPALGKPVLILRSVTERQEAVDAGVAKLAGTDPNVILGLAGQLLKDGPLYQSMARKTEVFGDGKASDRIVRAIGKRLGLGDTQPEEFKARY